MIHFYASKRTRELNGVPYLLFLGEEKGVISEDASDRFAEDN